MDQGEEQECRLIYTCTERQHEEQIKKDAKLLTDKKMLQQAELLRQGENKEKTRAIIEDLL